MINIQTTKHVLKKIIFLVMVSMLLTTACKNKKETATVDYTITTYKGTFANYQVFPNVPLYFYKSENDILLNNQNYVLTKTTDANGVYSTSEKLKVDSFDDMKNYYFVDGKTSQLNTKRYVKDSGPFYTYTVHQLFTSGSTGKNDKDMKGHGDLQLFLSSTPTKLRLTVLHTGTPVSNATVQLYKSLDDYTSNTINTSPDSETGVVLPGTAYTDSNGQVYFDELEPRQYWFRITYSSYSNAASTYSTDQSLPDDDNVTTDLSIGIN